MQISQCGAHIAHRVHDVGSDNEVERCRFQFLLHARFFEIEDLELHFRKGGELLLRSGKESSGHIAEDVGMQSALEERQRL